MTKTAETNPLPRIPASLELCPAHALIQMRDPLDDRHDVLTRRSSLEEPSNCTQRDGFVARLGIKPGGMHHHAGRCDARIGSDLSQNLDPRHPRHHLIED